MKLNAIFERARTAAVQVRQVIAFKEEEEYNRRSQIIVQILIGLSLAMLGFLLGFFS